MDTNELVSIIMPTKNADRYIEECLQSILAQSYSHWELLIANDHSTDQTADMLDHFSKLDSRIQIYVNDGRGITPALQTAFAQASGTYITRMDSDDVMTKDKLSKLVRLCRSELDLATGFVKYFSEGVLGEGYLKYADWLNQNMQSQDPFQAIYKECVIPSPCWMLRKTTFDKLGAFDSAQYPEDYDLCFRMRRAGLRIQAVDQVIHHWRDYPERSSRTDDNYTDNRFLEIKVSYFLKDDYNDARSLVIWGAGKKGKAVAKLLVDRKIPFHWISNNPKKIGHDIYGQVIQEESQLDMIPNAQCLICIAGPEDQNHIRNMLIRKDSVSVYWFC